MRTIRSLSLVLVAFAALNSPTREVAAACQAHYSTCTTDACAAYDFGPIPDCSTLCDEQCNGSPGGGAVDNCSENVEACGGLNFASRSCTCDGASCNPNGAGCLSSAQCCSNNCYGGSCADPFCYPNYWSCGSDFDCCSYNCDNGTCKAPA